MPKQNKSQNNLSSNPINRARSLADRLEQAPLADALRDFGCKLQCRASGQSLHWPSPIFSRIALDTANSPSWLPTLDRLRSRCGVSIIGPQLRNSQSQSDHLGSGAGRSLDDGLSIHPVFVDEPIRFDALMHAEQIELQFFPSRAQTSRSSSNSDNMALTADAWIPTLPSDLTDIEKMSKRIELLRSASDQPTVVVGGAISAGQVYNDVRFLIDSGVDYISIVSQATAGGSPPKIWNFQPVDFVIEQALGAIAKSGEPSVSLHICSSIHTAEDAVGLLSAGVDAFSIDTWLIHQQAKTPSSGNSSEDLGSFMGSYARTSTPALNDSVLVATESFLKDFMALRRFYEV